MEKFRKFLAENWKTSILGIITATATFLVNKHVIDTETATYIGGLAISVGLILAAETKTKKTK